jgi:hypothetical protein
MPEDVVNQSHKISVLLAEYNTLRAEVLAARANVARDFGIGATVTMAVIGFSISKSNSVPKWGPWLIATFALIYVSISLMWNEINTWRFTKRLRALEADINARAGERLLVWETESGWGSIVKRRKSRDE